MPCYQIQKVSVEFKATHIDLLEKAANDLKLSFIRSGAMVSVGGVIDIDLNKGTATFAQNYQGTVNSLKRSYSEQALKLAAKLGGWQIQKKNQNQGLLIRGSI